MKNKILKRILTVLAAVSVLPVQTAFCASDAARTLPDAGGFGRIIIYVVGGLILLFAVVGLLWVSWKNKNDK